MYSSTLSCEIDGNKLPNEDELKKNYDALINYCRLVLDSIYNSVDRFPREMQYFLSNLASQVQSKFKDSSNIRYVAVSAFLFLRLIGLSIMNPHLFGIVPLDDQSNKVGKSCLSNVAKVVQKIANMTKKKLDDVSGGGNKFQYLALVDNFVEEEQEKMKVFIDQISKPIDPNDVFKYEDEESHSIDTELASLLDHLEAQIDIVRTVSEVKLDSEDQVAEPQKGFDIDFSQVEAANSLIKTIEFVISAKKESNLSVPISSTKRAEAKTQVFTFKQARDLFNKIIRSEFKVGRQTIKLKTYPKSFKGTSLISWIMQNTDSTRESDALSFGSSLIQYQFMHCLSKANMSNETVVIDPKSLYRFYIDDNRKILNSKYLLMADSRPPLDVMNDIYHHLVKLFKSTTDNDMKNIAKSPQYEDFCELCLELQRVSLAKLSDTERKVFFINIYNILAVHAQISISSRSFKGNSNRGWAMLGLMGYIIAGHEFTLNDIEHGVLRSNRKHPKTQKKLFKEDDPRLEFCVKEFDSRIHFSLVTAPKTYPKLHTVTSLESDLHTSALAAIGDVVFSVHTKTVSVSPIFKWFFTDFGKTDDEVANYIAKYVPEGHPFKQMVQAHQSVNFAFNTSLEGRIFDGDIDVDYVSSEEEEEKKE
eukprot:TRINITY_DN3150_c0_g1_i2.p1 TRINITY_DN3150_c0_g1~~TRINITY_DN3150_c0_g1_i2.p1  ORF type:complete len:646 (+),score=135.98 TRINITY_DN3150_c0_g1_i2:256-2193(+)